LTEWASEMGLRALQSSGLEIRGYIEGFMTPFRGAGEGGWTGAVTGSRGEGNDGR
jgi:hypothetical protein